MITNNGKPDAEIQEKISATNRAFQVNKKLLKSRNLSKRTKLDIYKTIIRPVTMYAAETMIMTQKDEEKLRILRTILGPVQLAENVYRKSNSDTGSC